MPPLQIELALPAYTGLSDADAAAKLNALIVVGRKPVPIASFIASLFRGGLWAKLVIVADTLQTTDQGNAIRAAAISVTQWCNNQHTSTVDMDDADVKAALAGLVQAGIMPTGIVGEIDALANVTTTRAEQLGFKSPVNAAMIHRARAKS